MDSQAANFSSLVPEGIAQHVLRDAAFLRPLERPLFTQTFTLPGGYVDEEGLIHREVELAPVSGFEEELLGTMEPLGRSARLVTALLARSLKRVGTVPAVTTSLVRNLLVGDREFLMLRLRELTLGEKLKAMIVCGDPKCAQTMDIVLNLHDLIPAAKPVDRRIFQWKLHEGEQTFAFEFRLPTGADQEAAADWPSGDAGATINRLLAGMITRIDDNCSVDDQAIAMLPEPVLQKLERRIEELAPLAVIDLNVKCVECRRPSVARLDVTWLFLQELLLNRRVLEREVHCIAWHYHWPEREILALTRHKRRRYLELIQGEANGALFTAPTVARLQTQ